MSLSEQLFGLILNSKSLVDFFIQLNKMIQLRYRLSESTTDWFSPTLNRQPLHSLSSVIPAHEMAQIERTISHMTDIWSSKSAETVIEHLPVAIWQKDLQGNYTDVNPGFSQFFNLSTEHIIGKMDTEVFDGRSAKHLEWNDQHIVKNKKTTRYEFQFQSPQGTKHYQIHKTPLYDQSGIIHGTSGIAIDLTERKHMELELMKSVALLDSVIESSIDPIIVYAADGTIIKLNQAYCTNFNQDLLSIKSTPFLQHIKKINKQFQNGIDFLNYCKAVNHYLEADQSFILSTLDHKHFALNNAPYAINGILLGRVITFHDISNQIKYENELKLSEAVYKDLSIRDLLTGTYNRRKIIHELQNMSKEILDTQSYAILLFDLDNFKPINDCYGHFIGDEVLKRITKNVQELLRKKDIFGRWGGDEFIVIMPETSKDVAIKTADRIRRKIRQTELPISYDLSCSVGVSCYSTGTPIEDLISQADAAMYQSKKEGKDRVFICE